jgi:hypothetical protein
MRAFLAKKNPIKRDEIRVEIAIAGCRTEI